MTAAALAERGIVGERGRQVSKKEHKLLRHGFSASGPAPTRATAKGLLDLLGNEQKLAAQQAKENPSATVGALLRSACHTKGLLALLTDLFEEFVEDLLGLAGLIDRLGRLQVAAWIAHHDKRDHAHAVVRIALDTVNTGLGECD